ncbi:Organic hydroperoxide resistance protein OhrB [Burkholderia sp. AD24]|nr:Organic hydroperoxide resistance protein OhrB [Burkholderia sp. AD24]
MARVQSAGSISSKQCRAKPSVTLVGRSTAQELINKAHVVCAYSNATRNNIDVTLSLV